MITFDNLFIDGKYTFYSKINRAVLQFYRKNTVGKRI